MRVFVINKERRNWSRKDDDIREERRMSKGVSLRYLLIAADPALERAIKTEFSREPHAVYPHESGAESVFYCVAGGACAEEENFVRELFQRLEARRLKDPILGKLEVHFYKTEDRTMKVLSYKLVNDKIHRTLL
jgi:hypothetical protein